MKIIWLVLLGIPLACSEADFTPADQKRADRFAAHLETTAVADSIIDPEVIRGVSTLSHTHLDVVLRRSC